MEDAGARRRAPDQVGRRVHYEIEVEGRLRRVLVHRVGDGFAVDVDGRLWHVDAVRIDSHTLSLIVGGVPSNGDTGETTTIAGRRTEAGRCDARSGGLSHEVTVTSDGDGQSVALVGSTSFAVALNGRRREGRGWRPRRETVRSGLTAPMPGKIVRVLVAAGDTVHARQPLIVVEAMKMENELRAGRDGTVAEIHVKEGASVDAGAPLIDIL